MTALNFNKTSDADLLQHYRRMRNLHTYNMTQELRRQYILQELTAEAQRRGIEEQLP